MKFASPVTHKSLLIHHQVIQSFHSTFSNCQFGHKIRVWILASRDTRCFRLHRGEDYKWQNRKKSIWSCPECYDLLFLLSFNLSYSKTHACMGTFTVEHKRPFHYWKWHLVTVNNISRVKFPGVNIHYNFTPLYVCLSEMGDTAGFLRTKAQFNPLGNTFGSCGKRVGLFRFYSFRKRWDILEEDQEAGGSHFKRLEQ